MAREAPESTASVATEKEPLATEEERHVTAIACRHFSSKGFCLYGDQCRYQHMPDSHVSKGKGKGHEQRNESSPDADAAATAAFHACKAKVNTLRRTGAPKSSVLAAVDEMRALQKAWHACRAADRPKSRYQTRKKLQNCERAGIFRQFLVRAFGAETLRAGSGVLDVAGGHGFLAFELENVARVPVTVVDPRPLNMMRMERKWKLGETLIAHGSLDAQPPASAPEEAHRSYAARLVHRELHGARVKYGESFVKPRHWRHNWEPRLFEPIIAAAGAPPSVHELEALGALATEIRESALQMAWTVKGLVKVAMATAREPSRGEEEEAAAEEEEEEEEEEEAGEAASPTEHATVEAEVPTSRAMWDRIEHCSAIVGMHPDGATEAIVDFALASNKPFAVVPCCVYSALAPTRRNAAGKRVTEYAAFVQYLREKAPGRIGVEQLPFEGKNLVVFSLPAATRRSGEPECSRCDDEP